MLPSEEGKKAVKYARGVLESKVKGEGTPETPKNDFFGEGKGVFVTLNKGEDLRGCIGITQAEYSLGEAIERAASSCIKDPRFPPLQEDELEKVTVEVTVLTEPELVEVEDSDEYPEGIEIGKDGLLLESGRSQGLLLPQVPVEQGWNAKEFLNGVCQKARLHPGAWESRDMNIYKFQGQIFKEKKPRGKVVEREI